MFAALTLFLILTLSVVVVRTGAVALRHTGLPEETARFQSRTHQRRHIYGLPGRSYDAHGGHDATNELAHH